MRRKGFDVFLVCFISYSAIYVARMNLSVASPALIEKGVLDAVQIGVLGSAFSLCYSCGRLLNGTLTDRLAPILFIFTGLLLTGVANLGTGFLPAYPLFLLFWCLNALAQSMLWSAMLCTVSAASDAGVGDRRAALLVASVSVGNIASILLNTRLIRAFGVRAAFFVPGVLVLVLCLVSAWVLRRTPAALHAPSASRAHTLGLSGLLRSEPQLLRMLLPAVSHGVIKENIVLWMLVFFTDRFAIDLGSSAYFALLIPAVGLAGRLCYPAFYRLCGRNEHLVSLCAFGLCAVVSALLGLAPTTPFLAALGLSLLYASTSVINTSVLSIFPLRFADSGAVASVSGLMDFISYLGTAIGSAVYGLLIAGHRYTPMFLSWTFLSLLSLLLLHRQIVLGKNHPAVK